MPARQQPFANLPWIVILVLAIVGMSVTEAGETAVESADSESRRVFTPEDFERFAPRTALDMLQQVPGFVIREQVQERGLGQATGNVLLNGQRISGKSNDVIGELGRIPAGNVIRIEIVDGATLDVSGLSGQVANVVARAEGISGQYAWRPEFRAHNTEPRLRNFELSASGQTERVDYTLGLDNRSGHGGADGPTLILDGQGELLEQRQDQWASRFDQPRLSGRFAFNGHDDTVANVNILARRFRERFREDSLRSGPGLVDREREVRFDLDGYNYELGGDYEFSAGPGRLKLIGLTRYSTSDRTTRLHTRFADETPDAGNRFDRESTETEHILRSEYRLARSRGEWQLSAEAAFNQLDSTSSLFELRNGQFESIPLPAGTAVVEEDRYEMIGSHTRPLGAAWTLQVAAGGEYSKLVQVGAGGMTREFWRPKGSMSLAWDASADTDMNFRLQRRVGQLNFFDFLATVNLSDDVESAGNPDLRPPQLWEAEIEAATALGEIGTTTVLVYGHQIDDLVDIIPIGTDGESAGNIDSATRYGVEWKTTIDLDSFGWLGGKIDTRLQWQDSRVEDPLTGQTRPISHNLQNLASLALRSDPPGTEWGWGANASYTYRAKNYRLTEVGRMREGPVWASVYMEHKNVLGHTVRATVSNILGATSLWDRTVHDGRRTDPIAFIEQRDRRIGLIFSFSVQGQF